MKVVVNKCYGGFGISVQALKELVKRKAACVESFTPKKYYGGKNEKYKAGKDWEQNWNKDFARYENIGHGFMADKNRQYNVYKDGLIYSLKDRYENSLRTDKDLVDVVEKMGVKAHGHLSSLSVIEIPDGIDWELAEYDGMESIH